MADGVKKTLLSRNILTFMKLGGGVHWKKNHFLLQEKKSSTHGQNYTSIRKNALNTGFATQNIQIMLSPKTF